MKIALAQIAPVWLNRTATLEKVTARIQEAGQAEAKLIAFGEALVPGYPFWVERTDGARFGSAVQEEWFAHYSEQAVTIERGDLAAVQETARQHGIAVYLGVIERPPTGHSVHASLVYISASGEVGSVHRKLRPTHEERLVWSPGDGNGLTVHPLHEFTVGGLNCWENWMPLARTALYAQGENLHVAAWPGSRRNTYDITPVMAKEGRSFVVSVSGLMRPSDVPSDLELPLADELRTDAAETWADGGSCLAAPDGTWIIEPLPAAETIEYADLDIDVVRRARHNFEPAGHYSRPDVLRLNVNRQRLQPADLNWTENESDPPDEK